MKKDFDFYLTYTTTNDHIVNVYNDYKVNKNSISALKLDSRINDILLAKGINNIEDLIFLTNKNLTKYGLNDSDIEKLYDVVNTYLTTGSVEGLSVPSKVEANLDNDSSIVLKPTESKKTVEKHIETPKESKVEVHAKTPKEPEVEALDNELYQYDYEGLNSESIPLLTLNGITTLDKLMKLNQQKINSLKVGSKSILNNIKRARAEILGDQLFGEVKKRSKEAIIALKKSNSASLTQLTYDNNIDAKIDEVKAKPKEEIINSINYEEILNQEIFNLNNTTLLKDSKLLSLLKEYQDNRILFEFADNKYIHISRLNKAGITLDFIDKLVSDFPGYRSYFTIDKILKDERSNFPIPASFTRGLIEAFLKSSSSLDYVKINNVCFFGKKLEKDNPLIGYIKLIISRTWKMYKSLDDILDDIKRDFDIDATKDDIINFINKSDLYYLKKTNYIYLNELDYKKDKRYA